MKKELTFISTKIVVQGNPIITHIFAWAWNRIKRLSVFIDDTNKPFIVVKRNKEKKVGE